MISIYAFSLFLWICLAVQVPAQGALSKITKAKRVDLGEKFELIVEFESDSTVDAWWYKHVDGADVNLTGSKLEDGKTTLKLAKTEIDDGFIFLRLGDWPSHFVSLWWNIKGEGDKVATGECPLAVITPGLDLPNDPGQKLEVKVAVEEGRGLDHLSLSDDVPSMFGSFWDEATSSVGYVDVKEQVSFESQDGVTTSTFTFEAGPKQSIVGYYQGFLTGYADDWDKAPVLQLIEYFTLKFHKEGEEIPFPYDLN